jgi:erythromycin esterase
MHFVFSRKAIVTIFSEMSGNKLGKCMKQVLFLLLLITVFDDVQAQDIKNYVQQNAVAITTNQPDSIDFSDLETMGNAIGDARIVFLGEQDHGDAPSFLAKTRLIKYLHEKKGFNVLAFESDFFALNHGWDKLSKTKPVMDSFLQNNIFPLWTYCDACEQLLYDYIPKTHASANPIQMSGFDNQMVLYYSSKNLSKKLDSVLRSYDLPITKEANYSTAIIPLIDSLKRYKLKDVSQYVPQLNYLLTIKTQLGKVVAADNFWMMIVDNLVAENAEYRDINKFIESSNTRDEQMAKNLLWLAKIKYPNQKIIVWAHNTHISKYAGHYNQRFIDKNRYMGSVFDAIKDSTIKTYTLGFTSYSGSYGRLGSKSKKVKSPKNNGFENWIAESANFAFVDFKKFMTTTPGANSEFFMKGQHHFGSLKASWYKIYDGVFFIRNMYPCKSIFKTQPEDSRH